MDGLPFLASDCHQQVWNTPDEAIPHKLYFEKNRLPTLIYAESDDHLKAAKQPTEKAKLRTSIKNRNKICIFYDNKQTEIKAKTKTPET
ncbi:hypothetical protein [Pseudomonas sp. PS01297]|uniref:hypothetical protein n=1 Tax=Pseudomonas sp. PS01297 TaxID=2991433 RepID=UPI00249C2FE7|nr:hypothetical protein [Pseudomonas sp. PS01297]